METRSATPRKALHLRFKLKLEYSEICSYVRGKMALSVLWSNTLFLWVPRDKEARIQQRPDLSDGSVIELMDPW